MSAATAATLVWTVPVHAQDRDTLWTKVSAEGRTIVLTWDDSHPWDAALTAGGAELLARYVAEVRGQVSESLGRGMAPGGARRTLRFALPDGVRAPASGPVCLFIQLPDRRVLPIRRANDQNRDTVGFRYEAWDRQARLATESRIARERVAAAEQTLATSARNIGAREASLAKRGWTNLASCEQVAAPSAVLGPRPYDVVDPAEQDGVARRVCVNRIVNGYLVNQDFIEERLPKLLTEAAASKDPERAKNGITAVFSTAFAGPVGMTPATLVTAIVERLGVGNATVKAREAQTSAFLNDWAKWAPTLADYTPHLGTPNDDLSWPSTAVESAFRLFGPGVAGALKAEWAMQGVPAGSARDLESYLGSALDAYSGCVEDSAKQLRTKYDAWEGLRSAAPQRAASAREFLVRECRQEIGVLETMKTEREKFEAQLARDRQVLAVATSPAPLPTASQPLNGVACSAQP